MFPFYILFLCFSIFYITLNVNFYVCGTILINFLSVLLGKRDRIEGLVLFMVVDSLEFTQGGWGWKVLPNIDIQVCKEPYALVGMPVMP